MRLFIPLAQIVPISLNGILNALFMLFIDRCCHTVGKHSIADRVAAEIKNTCDAIDVAQLKQTRTHTQIHTLIQANGVRLSHRKQIYVTHCLARKLATFDLRGIVHL